MSGSGDRRDERRQRGGPGEHAVGGEPRSDHPLPRRGDRDNRIPGPTRTCVGCRTRAEAGTLVRVARRADGTLVVDRYAPGRGAWLCQDATTGGVSDQCLEVAARRDAFRRALKATVLPEAWMALRGTTTGREKMDTGPA